MSDDARPDPDALIARIRADDARSARGKLRIYFGSSAGVGKTYAMLAAARIAKAAGIDVVAGVVETHGRVDTAAQLQGLEVLPRKSAAAEGSAAQPEFDIDAALARRPALVLVDELAHSNVAGSRHPKCWQDDRHIRRFLRASLEAEGWRVFETETLRQGLIDAGTRRPDLVIADLGLPDGDGVDLIRDLRT